MLNKVSFVEQKNKVYTNTKIALLCLLILPLFLSGCIDSQTQISYDANTTYSAINTRLPISKAICELYSQNIEQQFLDFTVTNSAIFILAGTNEKYNAIVGTTVGNDLRQIALPSFGERVPLRIFAKSDGGFIVLAEEKGETLWNQYYYLYVFEASGDASFAPKQIIIPNEGALLDAAYDAQYDHLWILENTSLSSFDSRGVLQTTRESIGSEVFLSLAVGETDSTYLLVQKESFEIWRLTDGALNKEEHYILAGLSENELTQAKITSVGDQKDGALLIDTPYAVFEFSYGTNEVHKIIDKTYEGYTSLGRINVDEGQYFVMADWGGNDLMLDFGIYSFIAEKSKANVIRVAVIGLDESIVEELSASLRIMRQKNPDIRADIKVYSDQYLYEQIGDTNNAKSILSLFSGEMPDIFCIDESYLQLLQEASTFTDLTTLYRGDEDFSETNYLPSIWNAAKVANGHFFITPFFGLNGVMAKQDAFSFEQAATLPAFEAWIRSYPQDAHILRHDTPELLFETLWSFYMADLTAGGRVDENALYDLLQFCDDNGTEIYKDYVPVADQIANRNLMLAWTDVACYDQFLGYSSYFNGDPILTGLPGDGNGVPMITASMYVAIAETSDDKDNAWRVLSFFLSSDIQKRYDNFSAVGTGIPISSAEFDLMIETQYQKYIDGRSSFTGLLSDTENDSKISEIQAYMNQMTAGNHDRQPIENPIKAYPFPANVAEEAFRTAVSSAYRYSFPDFFLTSLATGEAELFFTGQCTAKEAASQIAERMNLYLSERYRN